VQTAISFFLVSACNVRCCETVMVLWMDNLCDNLLFSTVTHRRPSAVFLEQSGRQYTGYCATVSLMVVIFFKTMYIFKFER